jgi:outer membrane protein OmpA-like peptidoglycan-associated protein
MHRELRILVAGCTGLWLTAAAPPTFGQGVLNQSTFEQRLRPIPPALQGGHQGLPTIGAPQRGLPTTGAPTQRAEPPSNYRPASISERYHSASPSEHAPAARARSSGHRPSQQQERPKTSSAMKLPGCPAPSEAEQSEKPMVGFRVEFEFGSARLKPDAVEVLRELGKALNGGLSDQKLFEIEGHTDAVGTFAYNEQLSEARAEAVKEFLIKDMNVAPERLKVVGRAFCEPLNPQNPYAAQNRRVVVINQSS